MDDVTGSLPCPSPEAQSCLLRSGLPVEGIVRAAPPISCVSFQQCGRDRPGVWNSPRSVNRPIMLSPQASLSVLGQPQSLCSESRSWLSVWQKCTHPSMSRGSCVGVSTGSLETDPWWRASRCPRVRQDLHSHHYNMIPCLWNKTKNSLLSSWWKPYSYHDSVLSDGYQWWQWRGHECLRLIWRGWGFRGVSLVFRKECGVGRGRKALQGQGEGSVGTRRRSLEPGPTS